MTSRDDRHRRAAARLHALTIDLATEVVARGGSLDWYDLTDAERDEAQGKATTFWPERMRNVQVRLTYDLSRSRRLGRPPSTEP